MKPENYDQKLPASAEATEPALHETDNDNYVLRLYVSGMTLNSLRAIDNVRKICADYLEGRYHLEIIDIYQQPAIAKAGQIVVVPTLVKELPLPLRKFIGDMTQTDKILACLGLSNKGCRTY